MSRLTANFSPSPSPSPSPVPASTQDNNTEQQRADLKESEKNTEKNTERKKSEKNGEKQGSGGNEKVLWVDQSNADLLNKDSASIMDIELDPGNPASSSSSSAGKPQNQRTDELLPVRSAFTKYTLYETKQRLYLVGSTENENQFRVLKVDRTNSRELNVVEDETLYSKREIRDLLTMIEKGNAASGGMHFLTSAYGLLGFIRFLSVHYMLLVTKKTEVAMIGGHRIYHIEDTAMIPVQSKGELPSHPDEAKYVNIFTAIDLKRNFYFSHTYDLTHTFQYNMTHAQPVKGFKSNIMYLWNDFLIKNGFPDKPDTDWCLHLIHGFLDQTRISVFGKSLFLTLIARRSRYYAGARYLKRGVNQKGHVANDVETEQIVIDGTITPLMLSKSKWTSFVQHRGSIPLFWTQDLNASMGGMKPPIELQRSDPFYSAAALHFDSMFRRYGHPLFVLNLVKQKEKVPRESTLLKEYTLCVSYLNQFLPSSKKIKYYAWDMARASKSTDLDVIGTLADIADDTLKTTGFFQGGAISPELPLLSSLRKREKTPAGQSIQSGVVRTNCVDCLDRTNAAQFMIGKRALAYQLYALGVIEAPALEFDCDVVNILNEMYQDHGDTIALQYGGSQLVNTMQTYRKSGGWSSHSRDLINTIKRYYSNSFTDNEKQNAINLFLGNFIPDPAKPSLWELPTDYYLHNDDPRSKKQRRNYQRWFTREAREKERMSMSLPPSIGTLVKQLPSTFSETYVPDRLTFFDEVLRDVHNPIESPGKFNDPSPFRVKSTASMSYGIDIGGVIQWLTFKNKQPKKEVEDTSARVAPVAEDLDAEDMAVRLFYSSFGGSLPSIPSREASEYKWYVEAYTFKEEKQKLSSRYSRQENDYYLRYLKRNYLVDYAVSANDQSFYQDYVRNYDSFSQSTTGARADLYTNYLLGQKLMSIKLRPKL